MRSLPKIVLPRFGVMAKGPIEGLAEIRTSFNQTLANIEAALPNPPVPQLAPRLPRVEEVFKGPKAAFEEIKTTFEETVKGIVKKEEKAGEEKEVEGEVIPTLRGYL